MSEWVSGENSTHAKGTVSIPAFVAVSGQTTKVVGGRSQRDQEQVKQRHQHRGHDALGQSHLCAEIPPAASLYTGAAAGGRRHRARPASEQ